MKALFFGTYDVRRHPRVAVLMEGLQARGFETSELNLPMDDSTASRVEAGSRLYAAIRWGWLMARRWGVLAWRSRRHRRPGAVIVGYLGVFDVLLARALFPRSTLVLDHLAPVGATARDRSMSKVVARLLAFVDRVAEAAADVVVVDTTEQVGERAGKHVVVPVGASHAWFREPTSNESTTLRVVFYGLFTPLQGAAVIGDAIGLCVGEDISFTMIGRGQEWEDLRRAVGIDPRIDWIDWVDAEGLPSTVAAHDICLGIFGTTDKALRVVPNKVYQGAAAGCCVVTSDTPPQRRAFGGAAVLVGAGDAPALADALRSLNRDRDFLDRRKSACHRIAVDRFSPEVVVEPLVRRVREKR